MKRVLVLVAVLALFGALATAAAAEPDNSPVFFTDSFENHFTDTNPCTGELEEVWIDVEVFVHEFPRPNGFHGTALFWATTETSSGFFGAREPAGPDILNVNENNGVVSFNSIISQKLVNPETGERFRVHLNFHVTEVGGELVVEIDHFALECVGSNNG